VPVGYGIGFQLLLRFVGYYCFVALGRYEESKYGKYSRNFADHMYYITAIVVVAV